MIRSGTLLDLNRVTRARIKELNLRQYEEEKLRSYIRKGHKMGMWNGRMIYLLNHTDVTINTWLAINKGEEK